MSTTIKGRQSLGHISSTISRYSQDSLGRVINFRFVVGLAAVAYAFTIILPFYYLVVSSFKSSSEIIGSPLGLPNSLSLGKYITAENAASLLSAIRSSTAITAATEVLILILAFPAAYAIARIPSRLSTWIESTFNVGFLIPAFPVLVPLFIIITKVGLFGSPLALIVFYPAVRLAPTIVILASYLRTIPKELEEASILDGAKRWQSMLYVFLPLARPGIIVVAVLNFVEVWNEYFFALVLLSADNRTVQVAVPTLLSEHVTDYGLVAAGVVMSLVPVYAVFLFLQERIPAGLFAGAVKA